MKYSKTWSQMRPKPETWRATLDFASHAFAFAVLLAAILSLVWLGFPFPR